MDYRILKVHTDVIACDYTPGCMDTVRESALKVDWVKNLVTPLPGILKFCNKIISVVATTLLQ